MKIALTSLCAAFLTAAPEGNSQATNADLIKTAAEATSLSSFVRAVQASGLEEVLSQEGPFTVFAPSDAAFAEIPRETLAQLLAVENRPTLASILKQHVVSGELDAAAALRAGRVTTLAGTVLSIDIEAGQLEVAAAKVVRNDLRSSNGVIHVIDRVLLPPASAATSLLASTPAALIGLAIERGVPLYNRGDAAACTAVYEIAALSLLQSEALSPILRSKIGSAVRRARSQPPADAAWTLRRVLDRASIELSQSQSGEDMNEERGLRKIESAALSLFEFESAAETNSWRPLNDTVMGGLSSSRLVSSDAGTALFRGTTSLENNGGFASVRTAIQSGSLADATGISMRVRGDGRSYRLLVAESRSPGRGSYDREFETLDGVWITVNIPFEAMQLNIRGWRPESRPPSAEAIESIGILVGDKLSGDFNLEIDWIRANR